MGEGEGGGGGKWGKVVYGMQGEPVEVEASMTLHQPEVRSVFSYASCPWITGPWQWRAAQSPGGEVWIVTCACTQTSWWLQQQP